MSLTGNCSENTEGTLCSKCTKGYALDSRENCTKCEYDITFILSFILKLVLNAGIILFELSRRLGKWKDLKKIFESND